MLPLVILRCQERESLMSIRDREKRDLFTFHELFYEYLTACRAEHPIAQHRVYRALRFNGALRHDHPLSGSKTRCLYHHRRGEII